MGKKRPFDHQDNLHHHHHQQQQQSGQNQHQGSGGGVKKRSSVSSEQFRQLSGTHFAGNGNATATAMHACNGESPCNSSSTSTMFSDGNDDHRRRHASAVTAVKINNCSGEIETPSFVVAAEIQELFGGDELAFAPDLNSANGLVFVAADGVDGVGRYGYAKYTSDMLKLSSTEEMILEFLKFNLFD